MSRFPVTPPEPPVPVSPGSLSGHEPYIPDEPAHGKPMRRPAPSTGATEPAGDTSRGVASTDEGRGKDADAPLTKDAPGAYSKGDIVVSTRSWTRLTVDRIDTDPATGETMLIDPEGRSIMVTEARPTGATVAGNSDPLLVVVHPGSGCGSANYSLGRAHAIETRRALENLLAHWHGGVVVVDGSNSDELENYPLGGAITRALDTARDHHAIAERIFACDDETAHWPERVTDHLVDLPRSQTIVLAGAWYTPNPSINDNDPMVSRGCVNALYAQLAKSGFTRLSVEETASFAIPEED